MKEEKPTIDSKVVFDERRKVLTHTKKETRKTEFGELSIESKGIYHEEGIKKILGDLNKNKEVILENIKKIQECIDPTPEMTPELRELREKLKILQKVDHDERITDDDKKKEVEDLEKQKESLKNIEKDIREIKESIGTRLKL